MDWVVFYHCFFKQGFDFDVSKSFFGGISRCGFRVERFETWIWGWWTGCSRSCFLGVL